VTRERQEKSGGLSLQTLLISSVSAAVAAAVVPLFWEKGSIFATAITPIVVAIVSEALNRPAKAITEVAPKVARRSATGAALRSPQPTGVGARGAGPERVAHEPPDRGGEGGPPAWSGNADDPFGLRADEPARRRSPLKLAVATGLAAAVIGAGVVTASELTVFGHSIGHSSRETSLFGGKATKHKRAEETPTPTPGKSATKTATPSATRSATPTPTPSATTTPSPSPSATPTATTTASPSATPTPTP
jgi:cell division septation protein DedD